MAKRFLPVLFLSASYLSDISVLSTCVDAVDESHTRVRSPDPSVCDLNVNSINDDGASNVFNVYFSPCASDGTRPTVLSTCVDTADENHTKVTSLRAN